MSDLPTQPFDPFQQALHKTRCLLRRYCRRAYLAAVASGLSPDRTNLLHIQAGASGQWMVSDPRRFRARGRLNSSWSFMPWAPDDRTASLTGTQKEINHIDS